MSSKHGVSRRRFLALSGAITGSMLAAACTTATAPVPAVGDTAPATEAVKLRFRTWVSSATSPLDGAWYDWLTEHFSEDHEGSSIEFEFVPFGTEYIQKLLADVAAGSPPDLLDSSIIWARDFYDRGVLLELNDFLNLEPELAPDKFYGETTNLYRSKGNSFYGIPYWGPDSSVIAINSTLFEEAGLDPQGADIQSWDDFVEVAQQLTKREGDEVVQAGWIVGSMRYIEGFASWLYSNGGALHNPDITEPTFNNERAVQVLQFQLNLLNEHRVSFPISPEDQDLQLFVQGKAAMLHWGTWSPTYLAGNAPEDFKYWLIFFPPGPGGDGPRVTTWSNMIVIPQDSEQPEMAFELANYCASPPNVITRFELSNRSTPLKALYESEEWQVQVEKTPALGQIPAAAELGGIYPFFPIFTEANDAIGIELEQVMLGKKGIEAALAAAEEKIIEILARRAT
jgi:multiple sugar transport system substrate-binding protein